MYDLSSIRKIHLEVTERCQALCPQCARIENGKVLDQLGMNELSLGDCKKIFKPEFIAQLDEMFMCGNYGDPTSAKDTLEIFKYFREHNPTMRLNMTTNGGARKSEWWKELASVVDGVIFSVDGLKDTNHIYRVGVNWDNVMRSMKAYISAGGHAIWEYLIFAHNEHQVEETELLSKDMGFAEFKAKKTYRFERKGDTPTNLNPTTKVNPEIERQRTTTHYSTCGIDCISVRDNSLYISAEGLVLPCCFTAGMMYKPLTPARSEQIWKFIDEVGGKDDMSAVKNGLHKAFNSGIMTTIESSWNKDFENGRLVICARKCGDKYKPQEAQYE